jgi:hypothetical protein
MSSIVICLKTIKFILSIRGGHFLFFFQKIKLAKIFFSEKIIFKKIINFLFEKKISNQNFLFSKNFFLARSQVSFSDSVSRRKIRDFFLKNLKSFSLRTTD